MKGIKLRGTGRALPSKRVTNNDLAAVMDTSDEWITSRTGIQSRQHCAPEDSLTALCVTAARQALERAGLSPAQIGACIVATLSPETLVPSTACMLQRELGLPGDIPCFDLNAACSGFLFGLHTMECLLNASARPFGLVVGAEALSPLINWEDRGTAILFGDGAGAAVVECRKGWPSMGAVLGCRGDDELLFVNGPASGRPPRIVMEGTKVFKFAVETVPRCMDALLEKHGLTLEDIDLFVLHQANARILDLVAKKYRIPAEKLPQNVARCGNTSAASIPLLLAGLEEQGRLFPGARLLLAGFGGGLTWGGAILEVTKGDAL